MPIIKQIREDRRRGNGNYLLSFARKEKSQYGEDGILEKIFELIGEKNQWCVEFGAWDGVAHSNTHYLIKEKGWSSIQIEGNSVRFGQLLKTHGDNPKVHCINALVGFDPGKDTIETFFAKTEIPKDLDLLIIDIDGNDYHIWDSVKAYRPRVVMIEFNPVVPNDVVYIQDRDFSINQSSSLRALVQLGKTKRYELACICHGNAFFVVAEEFAKLNIEDNHINEMFVPGRDGKIFMMLDGTIVNIGLGETRLRQADPKPHLVDPFEFQVYSPEERFYGGRVPQEMRDQLAASSTSDGT